jgi:hypothetical protein
MDATRQAKLQSMAAEADAKDLLCAGRYPWQIQDLSPWDLTFDPPCYISGYYELFTIVAILATLKVGQVVDERRQLAAAPTAPEESPPGKAATPTSRGAQDRMRMGPGGDGGDGGDGGGDEDGDFLSKLKWPGADGGDGDFFPEGGPDDFDTSAGPLRRQILANANFVQGTLGGYQKLRPAMKASFAAVSIDGTDNGWINSAAEFKTLMSSVGELLSEEDNERLFALCRDREASFKGQRVGTVTFEQWVAVMLETAESEVKEKKFFGLF